MKRLLFSSLALLTMSALAEDKSRPIAFPRLEARVEIGPLVLDKIDPTHRWITVKWPPDYPVHGRRIDGKVPDENLTALFLSIQLAYISPAYSRDPKTRDIFQGIFVEGAKKLLENNRHFWFEVTDTSYAGLGQIGGVFLLDYLGGTTLQYEMVRCGYAVVNDSNSWPMVEKYRFDYRDSLLRAEGMARAWKLGVWSETK